MILVLVAGACGGCPWGPSSAPSKQPTASQAAGAAAAAFAPAAQDTVAAMPHSPLLPGQKIRAIVRIRMLTLQLPAGSLTESEQLWGYLNEEPLTKPDSALGVNGIRIGVGRAEDWPEIAKFLRELTGQQVKLQELLGEPSVPLPINLKQRQGEQTIFQYRPDRTMSAKDYPPGDNLLLATTNVNYDDLSSTILTVVPAVRSTQAQPKYVMAPSGAYMLTSQQDLFPLSGLECKLRVPAGSFVLIGPNSHAQKRFLSPGYHFLMRQREGTDFESVLVLFPQAVAAAVKEP